MSLKNAKIPSLKDKIEEKRALEAQLVKVDDKIDELVGDKKVKISKIKKQ